MNVHQVTFSPSGRSTFVADGRHHPPAAELAGEPVSAESGGRGACGRCMVRESWRASARIPAFFKREAGFPHVLAC